MISLQNIYLKDVLFDINMTIRRGDYIGIAGPNGSGKSTLARIIKGIQVQDEGTIYVDGFQRYSGMISPEIGLVLANPENQLVSSSIEEDVAFGPENMNLPPGEIASRVEEALRWGGLWESREVPAHHLSAGQQQMLALSGIVAMRPPFLILDEAASMLDPDGRLLILNAVERMNRDEGVGVIHISHDLSELLRTQVLYFINGGKIVWQGPPSSLHSQESLLSDIGMELPPLLKLKSLLLEDGYPIDEGAVTPEQMADEIVKVVGRKKNKNC